MISLLAFFSFVLAAPATYLKIEVPKNVGATPGDKVVVDFKVDIQKPFHIQANPAISKQYIATTLEMEKHEGVIFGPVEYPAGKSYRLSGGKTELSVYGGKIDIHLPVELSKEVNPGKLELSGTLRYQPCDETNCFFPQKAPVKVSILVKKPSR